MKNIKYFFVSYTGIKSVDPQKMGLDSDTIESISENLKDAGIKNGKMPVPFSSNTTLTSENGLFIPSLMESYIRVMTNSTDIKITFVKELSKEEYDADQEFLKEMMKHPDDRPLDRKVMSEIDDLVGMAESGKLKIKVDPDSEKQKDEFDDLFKRPSEWDD